MSSQKPIALEERGEEQGRLFSPSAGRNLTPIMEAFRDFGLVSGRVIEFGSGTGEHAAHLVQQHDELHWIASDRDHASRVSCQAWSDHFGHAHRMQVREIDLLSPADHVDLPEADIVYSSNVIHIAPIEVLLGILELSEHRLKTGGYMAFYGPFSRSGVHNSEGNANFDISLKSRDTSWGVRDLELDLMPAAKDAGLSLRHVRDMPANNYFVVFQKA